MKPIIKTSIPGPESIANIDSSAKYECPGILARHQRFEGESGDVIDPIVFKRAKGVWIEDVDGNVYLDAGSCFAVCSYGHCHPELVEVISHQAQNLMHGMGDVYPSKIKIEFLEKLANIVPGNLQQSILSQSGAEAVESAIKTAMIATQKSRMIAFENSYHGLSLGALSVTAHQSKFKTPFKERVACNTTHVPYPHCLRCPFGKVKESCDFYCLQQLRRLLTAPASGCDEVAGILVEPIQGRGGIVVPPEGWLKGLRDLCTELGILLILDEIYTGFGRTGDIFACDHEGVVPDLLCLGKAMTGGFPLSAVVGSQFLMSKWGLNTSEAIHTSTFLGNPMGCAMGIKALDLLQRDQLFINARLQGAKIRATLENIEKNYPDRIAEVRGRGLMLGAEVVKNRATLEPDADAAHLWVQKLLERGVICLSSGPFGHTLSITPPLVISDDETQTLCDALREVSVEVFS